jgi:hypothetical protein
VSIAGFGVALGVDESFGECEEEVPPYCEFFAGILVVCVALFSGEIFDCFSLNKSECEGCLSSESVERGYSFVKAQVGFECVYKGFCFVAIASEYYW